MSTGNGERPGTGAFPEAPGENFFRMIVENGDDLIAVLDLEGRRLYNSPSYERLLGDPREKRGSNSFAEIHPEDRANVEAAFTSTVETGRSHRLNYRFVLADGSIRHMESCGTLIRDSEGEPLWVVVASRDITEREEQVQKIQHLAFYDSLTQLPNRRLFYDRFELAAAGSRRSGRHCALMLLDLDNFKEINDTRGHALGDQVLVEVAERISSCLRDTDLVARFGGDEFVLLFHELSRDPEDSMRQAQVVAEKIHTALARPCLLPSTDTADSAERVEFSCTASIGIALFRGQETTMETVLQQADKAMYRAKEAGRNQTRLWS